MATKRRPLHSTIKSSSRANFSGNFDTSPPPSTSCDPKGKKPLPEPTTVQHVMLMMILHLCRKTMFVDTSVKVGVYGACLFLMSLLADVLPVPKTYFARSDNFFNQYFVKLGWGWTLLLTFPFIVLTSYTYCCGKQEKVFKHVMRLGISTFFWFFWIRLFHYIEANYGRCMSARMYTNKSACLANSGFWSGFDISGHAFILIYSNLVMIEEARAIVGWEGIRDLIRNEEHSRNIADKSLSNNPLRALTKEEFHNLKSSYEKFTPYIRSLFIAMTCLILLWDCMLVSTILYFHIMIEKFLSGAIAILLWFFTYRFWYTLPSMLPNLPGEGDFKYKDVRQSKEQLPKKKVPAPVNIAKGQLPTFMGMPLYGLRNQENKEDSEKEKEKESGQNTDETPYFSSSKMTMPEGFFKKNFT